MLVIRDYGMVRVLRLFGRRCDAFSLREEECFDEGLLWFSPQRFRQHIIIAVVVSLYPPRLLHIALFVDVRAGEIPPELGGLVALKTLNLSSNELTGKSGTGPASVDGCVFGRGRLLY